MNKPIHILTFTFFIVFGSLFFPHAAWSQSNLKSLSTGPWHGAVRGDEQGRATSCYLIAQKTNREFWILLRYDLTGLHLILFNKKWSLKAGDNYQGRVVIDNLFDDMVAVSTPKTTAIDIFLGNDEPTFESFQSGRRIKAYTHAGTKTFKLEGTRKAINVLLDCADKYLSADSNDTATAVPEPDYARGIKLYKNKNYSGALREWRPLADAGMVKAQVRMGILYFYGYGVSKNTTLSFEWFRKAAIQGNRQAENNLGVMYRDGLGVSQNDTKAIKWFRKAAAQGHKGAKKQLAKMLDSGRGGTKASSSESGVLAFWKVLPISQGRNVLYPGDKIRIGFTAPKGQDEYSWIGFVHDDAEADPTPQHFAQQIMKGHTAGVITLEVPAMLGNYRVWMYDRRNRKVLADLPVRIEIDTASARLELPDGTRLKPGENFDVTFKASPSYGSYVWVKIVGTDTPKDVEEKNIPEVEYLGHIRLNGKTSGTLSFTAPKKPGHYLLRMQDPGFIKTLTQVEFSVADPAAVELARPVPGKVEMPQPAASTGPEIAPTRPAFKPDEGVEVRFSGLPASGQDWLAISGEGQGPKQYYDFVMLKGRPVSGSHRFKPLPEGKYVVRLYTNWPDGGYKIVASSPVIVNSQPALPLPVPAVPLPPQPVAPVAALPAPPVAATETQPIARAETKISKVPPPNQQPPSAPGIIKRDDVTGSWEIIDGSFKTITLDQTSELVDGKTTGPDGLFSGEMVFGRLIGLWAIRNKTTQTPCSTEILGTRFWGSIEVLLDADGTTLRGSWGNCDQPRNDSFKAVRSDMAGRPPQQISEKVIPTAKKAAPKTIKAPQTSQNSVATKSAVNRIPDNGKSDALGYFTNLLCTTGELEKIAKLRPGRPVTCKKPGPLNIDNAPHDGNSYACPAGLEVRVDVNNYGKVDFVVYGFSWRSSSCVSPVKSVAKIFAAANAKLPDCAGWTAGGVKEGESFADWKNLSYADYECVGKNSDPVEVALMPQNSKTVLCKPSSLRLWTNGGLERCNLAEPTNITLPSGDIISCRPSLIEFSREGKFIKCHS